MLKVLNGAEVVINVHRWYNSVEGTNMRTFEAAGCRAFQLVEHKKEIGSLFEIGQEIEVYHGIEDLKEKIRYYLDRPKEREEIALRGQKRAYANHTYRQRFAELLEIVQWTEGQAAEAEALRRRDDAADELADVAIYLLLLAERLDVDLIAAIRRKMQSNDAKYPVDKARGRSTKYTDL